MVKLVLCNAKIGAHNIGSFSVKIPVVKTQNESSYRLK